MTNNKQAEKIILFILEGLIYLSFLTPFIFINGSISPFVVGKILFDSNKLKVEDLSSGNSIFNVWLKEPEFSNKKGEINFIGGHGGGWQGEGELFKIIFSATNEGEAELSFGDDLALYLNDGLGTELNPWQQPAKFMIQGRPQDVLPKDEWSEILGNDSIPPEEFTIEIG
ncbi:MAG: hypothetical protein COU51_00130 [Parcubacteria group bacterium CG10_big_fil_rev_8_21_14_0_10_36_14]|nr:MAG: hypothetical protein COU51_00130 [Parcubacteria group bacterium CG10_big_fil_rev_8_21_14_0_10_36_14]